MTVMPRLTEIGLFKVLTKTNAHCVEMSVNAMLTVGYPLASLHPELRESIHL